MDKTATGAVNYVNQFLTFCNTQAHNWYNAGTNIDKWSWIDGRCVVAPRIEIGWNRTVPYNGNIYAEIFSNGTSLYGYPGVYVWQ